MRGFIVTCRKTENEVSVSHFCTDPGASKELYDDLKAKGFLVVLYSAEVIEYN